MSVLIHAVAALSPAARAGILPGHTLVRIGGHEIDDVLDYRFHMTGASLSLELLDEAGQPYSAAVRKREYAELGLEFETYLIDRERACKNKCVFCFIDQLPPGLRESLYFKDDDSRLSFLFGNYITLTNLSERDVTRILEMHISPVNISVHTTNPRLRVEMMKNPRAGEVLEILPRLVQGGIKINAQIVLCPELNDGEELVRSLSDLCALAPGLQSVSVVPVGITRYREGLPGMRAFTAAEAAHTIDTLDRFGREMLEKHGEHTCWPGDEFFFLANRPIPSHEYYGGFPQLENGVGMTALLEHEFAQALALEDSAPAAREIIIATGALAASQLSRLAAMAQGRFPGLSITVIPIRNDFFGHAITVAGLVCGCDLIAQLEGRDLGAELLIPACMLRHERDLFLDGTSVRDVEQALGIPLRIVDSSGFDLLDAMLGN